MPPTQEQQEETRYISRTMEASIRLALVGFLVYWCYLIISPFFMPVIWGAIIAVAIYPLYLKLQALLGGRKNVAAVVYTLLTLAMLITPTVIISDSLIDTSQVLASDLHQGKLSIPPPKKRIAELPLIGEQLYSVWHQASTNLQATLKEYSPQLRQAGQMLISAATGAGGAIFMFVISIIISGIMLAHSGNSYQATVRFLQRLTTPEHGVQLALLARDTIRSVAQGVLGIAVIQAVLAAIGMYFMDVPGWGLWTLLVLIVAVAQIPPLLILGPVIAYVFTYADTTPAVIFAVYAILVSLSDGILKPMFLGRGMETPMPVILIGAIGGMLLSGIIGLFVGAIALALGYELFMAWLKRGIEVDSDEVEQVAR